jgi:anti-anti-sigma factor
MASIEITKQDPNVEKNYQVIVVKGEIDRDTTDQLRTEMEQIIPALEVRTLVFNLENLEFINSEGIGYLTDIFNRLYTLDKRVAILKASDRIMDIFQLVGLNQIIPCVGSEEEINTTTES